ncbi:hypothetical protein Pst134EB_006619 [Puccinia striiformis f. sp. tritici]|nr:hypothetical protein Pst134EB_006619 [Puccinia striiformis f. sp. tritici]
MYSLKPLIREKRSGYPFRGRLTAMTDSIIGALNSEGVIRDEELCANMHKKRTGSVPQTGSAAVTSTRDQTTPGGQELNLSPPCQRMEKFRSTQVFPPSSISFPSGQTVLIEPGAIDHPDGYVPQGSDCFHRDPDGVTSIPVIIIGLRIKDTGVESVLYAYYPN